MTFFLILSLTLSFSGLHITKSKGRSRPAYRARITWKTSLYIFDRPPTPRRAWNASARQVFALTQLTKPRGRGSRFGECLEIHRVSVDAAAHHVGSDWSLTLLRSLNDDQPRASTVSLTGPLG